MAYDQMVVLYFLANYHAHAPSSVIQSYQTGNSFYHNNSSLLVFIYDRRQIIISSISIISALPLSDRTNIFRHCCHLKLNEQVERFLEAVFFIIILNINKPVCFNTNRQTISTLSYTYRHKDAPTGSLSASQMFFAGCLHCVQVAPIIY